MRTAMPIKIDLTAELQVALTDPSVRAILSEYIKQAVKDAIAERETDTWLDRKGAAQLWGCQCRRSLASDGAIPNWTR